MKIYNYCTFYEKIVGQKFEIKNNNLNNQYSKAHSLVEKNMFEPQTSHTKYSTQCKNKRGILDDIYLISLKIEKKNKFPLLYSKVFTYNKILSKGNKWYTSIHWEFKKNNNDIQIYKYNIMNFCYDHCSYLETIDYNYLFNKNSKQFANNYKIVSLPELIYENSNLIYDICKLIAEISSSIVI